MNWAIVHDDDQTDAARALSERSGIPLRGHGGAGSDGIVFVGPDHSLARLASRVGTSAPILPSRPSDLGRMFGFGSGDLLERLAAGSPYPADLGSAATGTDRTPFVAHAIASRSGRIPSWSSPRAPVRLRTTGEWKEFEASGVILANAQHVGDRTVAPRSALMDGRGEYHVIGGPPSARLRALRAMRRGLHVGSSAITRRPFSTVELAIPGSWRLALDGAPLPGTEWTIEIQPGAWVLWV